MKTLLYILFFFIVSCSNDTELPELKDDDLKAKEALIGVWRGISRGENDIGEGKGLDEFWKIFRKQDGTFEVMYLLVNGKDKNYELSSDNGKWGFENGMYYEVDNNNLKTVYKVYSIKNDWFEYNQVERADNSKIQEVKTEMSYQLPQPPTDYTEIVRLNSE